jgi:hypothetical protein
MIKTILLFIFIVIVLNCETTFDCPIGNLCKKQKNQKTCQKIELKTEPKGFKEYYLPVIESFSNQIPKLGIHHNHHHSEENKKGSCLNEQIKPKRQNKSLFQNVPTCGSSICDDPNVKKKSS